MNKKTYPTQEVLDFEDLEVQGDLIPHSWYQHVLKPNGKVDYIAIIILADVLYWYRPKISIVNEEDDDLEVEKKFHGEYLQRGYKQLKAQFGMTENQARDSLKNLESLKLVQRIFKHVSTPQYELSNVMYLVPNTDEIKRITYHIEYDKV